MSTAVATTLLPSAEIIKHQSEELVLKENPGRWVMFPIRYDTLWAMYKKIENHFWAAEDFRFADNIADVKTMSTDLLDAIVKLISYHMLLDSESGTRPSALTIALLADVQLPEARAFYGFQLSYENIHSEVIGLMSQSIGGDFDDQSGKDKAEWIARQLKATGCFFKKLILQAITKLVFRSAFTILKDYLVKEKLLEVYTLALETIERDILIHLKFSYHVFSMLQFKMPLQEVRDLLNEAKELELAYLSAVLPLDVLGIKKSQLSGYIDSALDEILLIAGYNAEYVKGTDTVAWFKPLQVDKSFLAINKPKTAQPPPAAEANEQIEISFDEDF